MSVGTNITGDRGQPCLVPLQNAKGSDIFPFTKTHAEWREYNTIRNIFILPPSPIYSRVCSIYRHFTRSNAFSASVVRKREVIFVVQSCYIIVCFPCWDKLFFILSSSSRLTFRRLLVLGSLLLSINHFLLMQIRLHTPQPIIVQQKPIITTN